MKGWVGSDGSMLILRRCFVGKDEIRDREIHSRPSEFHQVNMLSFLWGPTDSFSST